jgi:hypothetical protein
VAGAAGRGRGGWRWRGRRWCSRGEHGQVGQARGVRPSEQRGPMVVVCVEAHPVAARPEHGAPRPFHSDRPSGANPAERYEQHPRARCQVGHRYERRDGAHARLIDAQGHARRAAGRRRPGNEKFTHHRPGHFRCARRNREFAAARLRARGRGRAAGWTGTRRRRGGEGQNRHGRQTPRESLARARHAFDIGGSAASLKPRDGNADGLRHALAP